MGWNGKTHNNPSYAISWHDSVRDERIEEFETEVYSKIHAVIEQAFQEKFAQEIAEEEITITLT